MTADYALDPFTGPRENDVALLLPLLAGDLYDLPGWTVPRQNRKHREHLLADMQAEGAEENRVWRGGVRSLADAVETLRHGWTEGAERALQLLDEVAEELPLPVNRRRQRCWSDVGDDLSTDRLYRGQETFWQGFTRPVKAGVMPTLTIAMSWGGNGNLAADQLFWTGAAAVALCSLLDEAAYSTRLVALDAVRWRTSYKGDAQYMVTSVEVKGHGDGLVVEDVVTIAAHPGLYRSLAFAATHLAPWDCGSGLGVSVDVSPLLPAIIDAGLLDRPEIVIPALRSRGAAVALLEQAITTINAANVAAMEV